MSTVGETLAKDESAHENNQPVWTKPNYPALWHLISLCSDQKEVTSHQQRAPQLDQAPITLVMCKPITKW